MNQTNCKNILKGVSTLDIMKKKLNAVLFLIILTIFTGNLFGGHSTLDLVDPLFNPDIQLYAYKSVSAMETLPDGKILAIGNFNSYNHVPVGKLVRLNSDGSLDSTFNNQIIMNGANTISVQSDGKIIVTGNVILSGQSSTRYIVRLNSDGTPDASFNQNAGWLPSAIENIAADSLGRFIVSGNFSTTLGARKIIRLNADGTFDPSFNFIANDANASVKRIATQGTRLIVATLSGFNNTTIYRANENGSLDTTFPVKSLVNHLIELVVQPDNKILYLTNNSIKRMNENGDEDNSFQTIMLSYPWSSTFKRAADGKIVLVYYATPRIERYLANGEVDASFPTYTQSTAFCYAIQSDGKIILGDSYDPGIDRPNLAINSFVRLTTSGVQDQTFNPGGVGFQNLIPGSISAIESQSNGKILVGGKFDTVNGIRRTKLARLNADSTLDSSFQVNTDPTGNYFSRIKVIYQTRTQNDGKIIVSGNFSYVINGTEKHHFVRLNSDGSIDPTYNFVPLIDDYSESMDYGKNRFVILNDNKSVIGNSKNPNPFVTEIYPTKVTQSGALDTTFNPVIVSQPTRFAIHDILLQPDGKIVVAGFYQLESSSGSFIVRLNSDGSTDTTFTYIEDLNHWKMTLALLPNGKILVGKHSTPFPVGKVERLNADGSRDTSFNSPQAGGVINALVPLPNGKTLVGGKFTITINGRTTKNLLQLNENGSYDSTVYNVNEEVLCLTMDGNGRVLVGGGFTVIGANGDNSARSYVARLTGSATRFDFDGDGRSDVSAFATADGKWTIRNSGSNQVSDMIFGLNGDKLAAEDYDGDGKADIAVFRPSNGVWYLWRSRDGFTAMQWGISEDKPVAADYDGDGKADVAAWRPSSGVWYVRQSSNAQLFAVQFGQAGDVPLTDADFDGDGRADIAVFRPSTGVFYWLASGSNNQFRAVQFGQNGDVPVAGDFNGDGKTDLVVFRPSDGIWYQLLTQTNGGYIYSGFSFGMNGDEPIAADYDGDGKTDIAVRRGNIWHINRTNDGYVSVLFADAGDLAVPSSHIR